jgi:ribosomal protein S27AE
VEDFALVLAGAVGIALVLFGPVLLWHLTDGAKIKALARAECPRCGAVQGLGWAQHVEREFGKSTSGMRMVAGGYVPSAEAGAAWPLECDECKAALLFLVTEEKLVESTEGEPGA